MNADLKLKLLGFIADTLVCPVLHVSWSLRKRQQVQFSFHLPQTLANFKRLLQPARLRRFVFARITPIKALTAAPEWVPALLVDDSTSTVAGWTSTVAGWTKNPLTATAEVHVSSRSQNPFTVDMDYAWQCQRLLRESRGIYLRGMRTNQRRIPFLPVSTTCGVARSNTLGVAFSFE